LARPVLLDTDIGSDVDDALALGVLLASPELRLVGATCVARIARRRAAAAARLLGVAGRADVPVFVGEDEALLRKGRFVWREIEDRGLPEGPDASIRDEPAPEAIVRLAREVPDLELVAIGPLTNLARALAIDPKLPRRVAGLTVMGGHVRQVRIGALVCRPGIDYNLCSDPEATMAVLGAGFATRLVTADVTLETWLTRADLARLEEAGRVPRALAVMVRAWTPWQAKIFGEIGGTLDPDNVAFLHDPLTVQALVDPSPLRFERLRILPTIQDGVLRTLEVPPGSALGSEMEVATAVDARAASAAIVDRLLRLP
jgi:inosine-uridine nucleoside N-ribohydrolase